MNTEVWIDSAGRIQSKIQQNHGHLGMGQREEYSDQPLEKNTINSIEKNDNENSCVTENYRIRKKVVGVFK